MDKLEGEAFHRYDPAFDKSLGFAVCLGQHSELPARAIMSKPLLRILLNRAAAAYR